MVITQSHASYHRKGVADLERRCILLLEMQCEQPTPAGSMPAREWAAIMKAAIM